jgi:hypothetical protein
MSETDFPVALDSFTNPSATTSTNGGGSPALAHHEQHAKANDAITALEAKVGIDTSTDHASIDWKLGDARTRLSAAEGTLTTKADLVAGKVPSAQLPSYVDDVLEYANLAALPGTGETGKIYITLDDNAQYRWSGSVYVQLVASPGSSDAVPEGTTNLYFTAARVRAVVLTGLSTATNAVISATDTVLGAFGKLQAQISAVLANVLTAPTGSGEILNTADSGKTVALGSDGALDTAFLGWAPLVHGTAVTTGQAPNWDLSRVQQYTLGANINFAWSQQPNSSQLLRLWLKQDATGGRTITFSGLGLTPAFASIQPNPAPNSLTEYTVYFDVASTSFFLESIISDGVFYDGGSAGAAPLASPTFTGDPKAPTPSPGDNDTSIATTAFVTAAIAAAGGGSGGSISVYFA